MTARPSFNPSGSHVGVARLPGFDESLRLLVEREQYSRSDIAMMFGVTTQRICQLCDRRGLPRPKTLGLNAVRVWDDTAHRFQPVSKGELAETRRAATSARRQARSSARRAARRARIVDLATRLAVALNREPTMGEIWHHMGGAEDDRNAFVKVINRFDGRARPCEEKLRDFRKATGFAGRGRGSRGHRPGSPTAPGARVTHCKRGHSEYRVTPKGCRYCVVCDRERKRTHRESVPHSPHSDTLRKP